MTVALTHMVCINAVMTTGDDYEEIEINPNLEVTDETTFTFSFQVLEAATRHE